MKGLGRNKGVLICMLLFILAQLLKISGIHFLEKNYGTGRLEIYPETPIEVKKFCLEEGYKSLMPIGLSSQKCEMHKGQKRVAVVAKGTNAYFPMLEPISMQDGAFFGERAASEGRNVVVISDELALLLFGSPFVTGKSCTINDVSYQIVGVYTKYRHLLDTFFDLGEEVVYLPMTSQIGRQAGIEVILLPPTWKEEAIEEKDLLKLGLDGNSSLIYHAEDACERLQAGVEAASCLSALVLIGYCVYYAFKLFEEKTLSYKKKLILLGSYGLISCVAFVLGVKAFYIPTDVLPPYNIFDLSYYWDSFKKQLVLHHQLLRRQLTYFESLYWMLRQGSLLLTLLQVLLSFPISHWFLKQVNKGLLH